MNTGVSLSEQQSKIVDWLLCEKGSALILARAGCGKTFTIKHMVKMIAEKRLGDVYIGAFNRAIADEINVDVEKLGIPWNVCAVNTAHGFGLGIIRKVWKNIKVDANKMATIMDEIEDSEDARLEIFPDLRPVPVPDPNIARSCRDAIIQLVSFAKQRAVGFTRSSLEDAARDEVWWQIINHYGIDDLPDSVDMNQVIYFAREALHKSAALDSQVIDFDDMVSVPITHNMRVWTRQFVFIDEAQDTNPARRALFSKMLSPNGGRLIAVGDDMQAINGFAGADNDALELIKEAFNAKVMPLTTTFRCSKLVVREAHAYVRDIAAREDAPDGSVKHMLFDKEEMTRWFMNSNSDKNPNVGDAILCRTTAPLIETAYSMIRNGIGCYVEGRDIGAGIVKLIKKWKVRNVQGLVDHIEAWRAREVQKWTAKNQPSRAASVDDRAETLLSICDRYQAETTISEVIADVERMFTDSVKADGKVIIDRSKTITLSTIHKAKGREWNRVFFLHSNKCPSPWAKAQWEQQQEINLIYVAITRAQNQLIFVNEV